MLIDEHLELSDAQAVTASAASEDVIDTGANGQDLGGNPALLAEAKVSADFATCTSLQAVLQDSPDNSTWSDLVEGEVVAVAAALTGKTLLRTAIPDGHARYLRLNYVIVGSSATAGSVEARITANPQTA